MRTLKLACISSVVIPLLCSPAAAQTPLFGDFGVPAWSRLYKYFEGRFGAVAADDLVLVLPTATNAAWDDHNPYLRLMEMHKWGDWMPSNAWQYAPTANKRLSEGYRYFLNAAFLSAVDANGTASPALKGALRRANEELQFTRAQYNEIIQEADAAYEAFLRASPANQGKSKRQFFKDQQYDAEIETRKKRFDSATETFKIVTSSIVDPDIDLLTRAKLAYENPKQQVLLPPVREVLGDKDRWQKHYTSFLDKDIFAFLRDTVAQNQNILESTQMSNSFETRWSASVSVSFLGLFRAGGASAEQVKREQHIKANTTKINITFDNLDTFNIVRGDWFNQNVIDRFAGRLSVDYFTAVWGPNGQLELIPKSVLVGRNICFQIYADSNSLDYLYEHFRGGADAGFFVGYFRVGGGGNYSSTKEQVRTTKFTDHLSVCDLSGRAKVIGVLAKHYAATLPKPTAIPSAGITPAARANARRDIEAQWSKSAPMDMFKGRVDAKVLKDLAEDL